ncbi:O-methyltransferase [Aureivirga marina]|uniref:O-methyltransferase n=1 Tax=Aureivirga marina TaxID=1182451 RepID=UPI0018CBE407|nr:class I SAM-dependent methyltransferase [Aureivirga marina]
MIEKSKLKQTEKQKVTFFQQQFKFDNRIISITDFGAGSRVFNSDERKIHLIAKYAGMSKKKSEILLKLIAFYKIEKILEFGTSLGIGTSMMKIGNPVAKITTMEGCPETSKIAKEYFEKNALNNIEILVGEFENSFKKIENQKFDLIYFDGNHQKEPTLNYFKRCLDFKTEKSIFIFDDIHWSKEMLEAWEIIKNHSEVIATIDTFDMGIVFFNSKMKKEHTLSYKF